jgi:hypothetical protein
MHKTVATSTRQFFNTPALMYFRTASPRSTANADCRSILNCDATLNFLFEDFLGGLAGLARRIHHAWQLISSQIRRL